MGALHEGHLSLIRAIAEPQRVVSIFVNPTQFGPGEDLDRYPRQEERDFAFCRECAVDVVFAPSVDAMYPRRTTVVSVSDVTERWEGAHRPGHFDGVTTVVCKLFQLVRPTSALFGRKDLQQCAVVRRMVEDLNLPVNLVWGETVREPDGLAMSSRNTRLTPSARAIAPELYRTLCEAQSKLLEGPESEEKTRYIVQNSVDTLERSGFDVDYFALVDTDSLKELSIATSSASLIVAAKLGDVRLIDNVQLGDF